MSALWNNQYPEVEEPLYGFLQLEMIRQIHLSGHKNPEAVSPDNWNMDFAFMERPNARRVHMDLFYDYRTNVEFLKEYQPKSLIFWGQNDIIFTREGRRSKTLNDLQTLRCTGLRQDTLLWKIALMESLVTSTDFILKE